MTLHPDPHAEELFSIYRQADRKTKMIIRNMLLIEIARRGKKQPNHNLKDKSWHKYLSIAFSGILILSLIPNLPENLLSIPVALGGSISMAIIFDAIETSIFALSVKSQCD